MKPALKNSLAVFYPQGFLDGENAKAIIEPQDIAYLANKKCEAVLISLKKIVFFNKRGLSTAVELLSQIQEKTQAVIGFCDYDEKKYKTILEMYQYKVSFSLFETDQIAMLFAGVPLSKDPDTKKIVIYNDNLEQKNHLAMELYERGYKPIIARDVQQFATIKADSEFSISNSYLGSSEKHVKVHIKDNVIVYSLPSFVDSVLAEKFDMRYHDNSLKVGFHYFLFNAEKVSSINVHGVNFLAKLSTAGAEYGATIAISGLSDHNITQGLRHDLEDAGILLYDALGDFFDDEELLGESGGGAVSNKKPRHVTKQLIENLSIITQTALHTVEVMTQCSVEKKGIKVQPLKLDEKSDMIAAAIAFYGDMNGLLILAFDQEIAARSCNVLLEEEEKNDKGALLDALGEFVNIIGGKIIQQMLKKHCRLEITMPRTYETISEVLQQKKDTKGAQVDFLIEGRPLTLFLTR